MKVCEICDKEISTRDGDNRCDKHQDTKRKRKKSARQEAMESLGLKRVRGALGGTYYE